jgi:hypothetical protein
MKRRRGLDSVTAAVGDAAGALRRRREARLPYAKVYDERGSAALLHPESAEARALIEAADALVEVSGLPPARDREA